METPPTNGSSAAGIATKLKRLFSRGYKDVSFLDCGYKNISPDVSQFSYSLSRFLWSASSLLVKLISFLVIMSFVGKWKLTTQENFDEYMKAIGNKVCIMLAKAATPQVEYSADGDNWTIVTTGLRDTTVKCKMGVEQDDETTDGRKVKTIYTLESPTKMVQKEKWDGKEATLVREVHGDELKVTITLDGVVCTRNYKRV
uniref:Cytosolic fatty-acid binding proteins domain-containing protein n=1 Tax=Daphnia galeata TaxID=27404 RepID=A0A8J2WFR4_9CRUS|nr:unnamed protein product [Daphnia galeata]